MARKENEAAYSAHGGKTVFVVDEAQETLRTLAKTLPGQFARSLGKLGSLLRKDIRQAMESGGPSGTSWPGLVKWGPNRTPNSGRKRRRKSRYSGRAARWMGAHFFAETRTGKPYGRLYSAGRYILDKENLNVQVGWVTRTAAMAGKKVQAALRGPRWDQDPRFDESQPVTRTMRRALAAAGLILKKGKRELRQTQRPAIRAIYQQFEPRIPQIITDSVARYLAQGKTS